MQSDWYLMNSLSHCSCLQLLKCFATYSCQLISKCFVTFMILFLAQVYQEESGSEINGVFHINLLTSQSQLTSLTLQHKNVADAADILHRYVI